MSSTAPHKILIADGRPEGGVGSFAEALRLGFTELGIPVESLPAAAILCRLGSLRDPGVLKILSLGAVFGAPIARRSICVAHGFPCAQHQGWPRTLAILGAYKLATASPGAQLVVVSEYSALHLRAIFGLRVDAVIHNPVHPVFLEATREAATERVAITFVGRLHHAKNVHRLLPAIRNVLDENPGLRAWIVGDGPMRLALERIAGDDKRIEFLGALAPHHVRDRLRRSRVFVTANPAEHFGIVYLEALSQGCAVAMPCSGGGLEIAPQLIGSGIHLFSASLARDSIASALRLALAAGDRRVPLEAYSPRAVAGTYLSADARFSAEGTFHAEESQ